MPFSNTFRNCSPYPLSYLKKRPQGICINGRQDSKVKLIIGVWDIDTLWILHLYPNPHPCQSSSYLILKRDTFTAISLRLDRKTPFSRRLFNGGAITVPMHPLVLITLASRNNQSQPQASLPIRSLSGNSTIFIPVESKK